MFRLIKNCRTNPTPMADAAASSAAPVTASNQAGIFVDYHSKDGGKTRISGMQAVRSSGQTEVNELPTNHLVFIEEGFGPLSAGLTELGSERGVFDQSLQRGGQGGRFAGRHE